MLHSISGFTKTLAMYNQQRLQPGSMCLPLSREIEYIETIRNEGAKQLSSFTYQGDTPTNSLNWFEFLKTIGPGQNDPLFSWLETTATMEQMKWFLRQEAAGEAGFDDLVALTQVKMPTQAKLEMARNYWDEMGNGEERKMHGRLLSDILIHLELTPSPVEEAIEETLLLNNLMMGLACNRRYAWLSVGALGAIEMTAPGRVDKVNKGLARLGVPEVARRYFALHAILDLRHSRDWNDNVIKPLESNPEAIAGICEGAYLRLWAGSKCYARYRKELKV